MKTYLRVLIVLGLALCLGFVFSEALQEKGPVRGLWISAVGKSNVLSSREGIWKAVSFAKKEGISLLFVQVYRGDQSWFDSRIADPEPFKKNRTLVKADALQFLIEEAHRQGIEIHAWINTLTLSQNQQAPLLKRHGQGILTKDQYGQPAMRFRKKKAPAQDRYYLIEKQLFLEPGDERIRRHVVSIVRELVSRYPDLDGIHLDYIRYPAAPPYVPGSRFHGVGLTYGYGKENVRRFQEQTGIDPHAIQGRTDLGNTWDDWKRDQVTGLVRDISSEIKKIKPAVKLSCAVISEFDRAYFAAYQDWPRWLEEGLADFVVLMLYTLDERYLELAARSSVSLGPTPQKVWIGLGAFLLRGKPEYLKRQIRYCAGLNPGGIVFFEYDSFYEMATLTGDFKT